MRIGTGYDVHKLVEGRKLILGGVEIPYEKGLLGHSDADVHRRRRGKAHDPEPDRPGSEREGEERPLPCPGGADLWRQDRTDPGYAFSTGFRPADRFSAS